MEIRISATKHKLGINWQELWRFRDLFLILCWRNISVRYKQTALGVIWVIFQPIMTMIIFSLIFNRMAGIQSGDGSPYPLFLYVGLIFWQYYFSALTNASNSMIEDAELIKKVYFPRLIIPAAAAMAALVDFLIASGILVLMIFFYGYTISLKMILIFPVLIVMTFFTAIGMGFFLAGVNVKYRDVRYALPFFIQMLLYVTPVIYPVHILSNHPIVKNIILWFNPVSVVITTARWALVDHGPMEWTILFRAGLTSILFLWGGVYYFRKVEQYFADII